MEGTTLSRYRIIEKIGAGGMGVVYRAHDLRLERDVALKALPAGLLAGDAARKRFRKEALALSRLNHPNIATVFDFDAQETAHGRIDFLVMEHIEGETLARRVAGGPIPERDVAALGAQMAAALEAAHERGVVHRDLKPGNIMVTRKGALKVLDFGLATLLQPDTASSMADTMSQTQGVVGTIPYMPPEQLRGERVDARSDIYAAGAVLFEMATGRRAFPEENAVRLINAIQHETPPAPSAVTAGLSVALDGIVLKALDKDPARRYQSARELRADLERLGGTAGPPFASAERPASTGARLSGARIVFAIALLAGLAVALLVGLNVGGMRDRLIRSAGRSDGSGEPAPAAATPRIESLAVLPLSNLSGDKEQEYFADGMTEELITDLAKIGSLRVISRSSVVRFKGTDRPLPEIARQLHVDAFIEGSVLKVGDRVRINAQLLDAAGDRHLWAESYEREMRDVLTLQGEIAQAIARRVEAAVTPQDSARLATARPVDRAAHEAYLRGRFFWNRRTAADMQTAIRHFNEALQSDPNYAAAYAGLAACYDLMTDYQPVPASEVFPKAKEYARRALALDETLPEAHVALAYALDRYDWDWAGAEKEYKRAIELNPGDATAHAWYAELLTLRGRFEEGLAQVARALELDPLSLQINTDAGWYRFLARQNDAAIEQLRRTVELDPNFANAHFVLAEPYVVKRMFDEAISEFQAYERLAAGGHKSIGLAITYAASGRKSEAARLVDAMERTSDPPHATIAMALGYLGRLDDAFRHLELALAAHDDILTYLKVHPFFDPLRSDRRFDALERRVGPRTQ